MRIKFQTAEDVLSAFPTLADDIAARPDGSEPMAFVKRLAGSETPEDSLGFFAYLAPRREAVWWACRCLDALEMTPGAATLAAARAWVANPDEDERLAALRAADAGDDELAATWAARGAGWSGGSIVPDGPTPVAAAPHLTAKAVRAAVLIAVASAPRAERRTRLERCVDEALAVAGEEIGAHAGG
ncbi:MAG: hypothetical protein AcusKO_49650 [Acuticoccus sp.]